jgi:hypothetical protein
VAPVAANIAPVAIFEPLPDTAPEEAPPVAAPAPVFVAPVPAPVPAPAPVATVVAPAPSIPMAAPPPAAVASPAPPFASPRLVTPALATAVSRASSPAHPIPDDVTQTIEALVSQGRWQQVVDLLTQRADKLTPAQALLFAVAIRELAPAPPEDDLRKADSLALHSLAALMGVANDSPVALMLARRMVRRNWRSAPAPRTRTSLFIILAAVVIGSVVGILWDQASERVHGRPTATSTAGESPAPPAQ